MLKGVEVNFIVGTPAELQPVLMTEMARYRYRVFIEKLGWNLPCEHALEYDQFDREDTLYVLARDDDGQIVGTARLLPTTRPYLLADVFPELLNGMPAPESAEVWELSRFAAMDFSQADCNPLSQVSSRVAVELLNAALACAGEHGARRVVTVSPLGVERLLRKAGFRAHRLGPPIAVDGSPIFACSIPVPEHCVADLYPPVWFPQGLGLKPLLHRAAQHVAGVPALA
ncbi:acyl-homoserine-lactone synthase [Chitiniphilus shinanonensis]|uniref:Acyl-homoserine-lactone synthase n=2 Tax=Chitiniphilus shinanonensis TaxID=553088 RepID=A0ABQ6BYK3_9NEIS|nr:acyl-homoserine-lactone synthase [Chitiniphilus shinanonensis]